MQGDLTTLERAKAWLAPDQGQLTSQNDEMISRLVSAVSRLAMNTMGRDTLARVQRTEAYRGGRTGVLVLRHWPVLSVGSLVIATTTTALAASDYALDAVRPAGGSQSIRLALGRTFASPGTNGVSVIYTSGFVRTESLVVPSVSPYSVTVGGMWLQDEGVSQNGAPVVGYTVSDGVYSMPAGTAGQTVDISYSCVPEDIEQAVIQEVAMLVRSRSHIGEASRALPQGAGTVSYLPVRLSELSQQILARYSRTVPS